MSDLRTFEVPSDVTTDDWALRVTGAVKSPADLSHADLVSLQSETFTADFSCVEGWVAEDLTWRGVRGQTILERVEPTASAEYALVHGMDGDYACSFALDRFVESVLAVELDGEPLTAEHGGPARLVPTDAESDCWESIKWVSRIDLREERPLANDTAEELALSRLE